jgi:hypothetical protein
MQINYFKFSSRENFDTHFNIDGMACYVRRDNDGTFISIDGLNFLGQPSSTMFRACSRLPFTNGYYIPDLDNLSLEEIKAFARNIIELKRTGQYIWNKKTRKIEFSLQCGQMV